MEKIEHGMHFCHCFVVNDLDIFRRELLCRLKVVSPADV